MKAVTVTASRELELREVPTPTEVPSGHLLIEIRSAAINHGDKTFLKMPAAATGLNTSKHEIWGASAAGRVLAVGAHVHADYSGKNVAVYRSLTPSSETVGLWCERAVVPVTSCVLLPEELSSADYSGSLVNVITAHAFLEEMASEGHTGVIVTVGGSATGLALAALARLKNIPVLFLARSERAAEALRALQLKHVLVTSDAGFDAMFERLAAELKTTAVFDGVGGDLITRIAPRLPRNSTVWFYGFLAGMEPVALPSAIYMAKNLTMKPFSNFNSATVRDSVKLQHALEYLQKQIADPLFRTKVGKTFRLDQIQEAMAYETEPGAKAVFLP
ncbi:alcohol dehydrogenase catalytic domain-containing protein [Telmatobacter bradus]|uniref:alcohol dehydrogenase catalytic domain-containing protein n=1 Tax=Telmatobacter bradus TaxID=474953 RepID=UPI003B427A7C